MVKLELINELCVCSVTGRNLWRCFIVVTDVKVMWGWVKNLYVQNHSEDFVKKYESTACIFQGWYLYYSSNRDFDSW